MGINAWLQSEQPEPVTVPEYREDNSPLVRHFIANYNREYREVNSNVGR